MKKNKWIIIIILTLVVAVIVLVVLKSQGVLGQESSRKVTVEEVSLRTIIETVTANGKIQPEKDIKVSPFIGGEVVELTVKEGDQVTIGQLLAKIDPEQYRTAYTRSEAALNSQKASVANAKASVAQAKAEYVQNELDFNRNKGLWEKKVISNADFEKVKANFEVSKSRVDAAKENLKSAEFQVKSSEASLKEARENLTRTAVFAPQDGTVSLLNVEKGERVQGASQFSAGTELMRIANLHNMEVHVEVNENDIVRVAIGDTTLIEVDAYLKDKFKGIVTEIATSANTQGTSADQVTNFDVKILMLSQSYSHLSDGKPAGYSPFRPGMSASVDIQTDVKRMIPTIEIAAVTTRDDTTGRKQTAYQKRKQERENKEIDPADESVEKEMKEYVFLHIDGEAVLREVETGIQDNRYIEITDGLSQGEAVITGPYSAVSKDLKNNDQVEKTSKDQVFDKKDK
ncbi:MAG: HlyD family efflux transporter periplasmic adaptor subunit [Bacteroidales bacterium]|nr:HlyD family efflux transporter periplasmic adaptor subunit [Bacteroidales bacterium]